MAEGALEAVLDLLARRMGLDPASVGEKTVARAVLARMQACGLESENEYLSLVSEEAEEAAELMEILVVPETWFFRDAGPFDCLVHLARERGPSAVRPLRVLSAPCSTGEEPFSAAMALLHAGCAPDDFRIIAADISTRALETAGRGVYSSSSFRTIGPHDPRAAFERFGDAWRVSEEVRRSVKFVCANMVEDGFLHGAAPFDVIFCKNLAIYLNEPARKRLTSNLHGLLARDGVVFTGHTETFIFQRAGFEPLNFERAFACRKEAVRSPRFGPVSRSTSAPAMPSSQPAEIPPRPAEPAFAPPPSGPSAAVAGGLDAVRRAADRGELEQAEELCRAYLEENRAEADAHFLMGLVDQARGRPSRAEKQFKKALYLDPAHYAALVSMTLICEQKGETARAETYRRRAERTRTGADYGAVE